MTVKEQLLEIQGLCNYQVQLKTLYKREDFFYC